MFPEQINYFKGLPFSIEFSNVMQEPPHYHEEMEVTLVLQGSTTYKVYQQVYHLKEGDILVLDSEDLHHIYNSSSDVLMLTMHLNLDFFDDIYPNIDYMIFACNVHGRESSVQPQQHSKLMMLKKILAEIMIISIEEEQNYDAVMEKINHFLYVITNHFQSFFIDNNEFIFNDSEVNTVDLSRLYRIIKYIYYNYDKKITLNDLAHLEHLSPYYISHMIKSTSGLNFQNFLNYMRMEFAEKLLIDNKMTLTQISESCGFSSLAYMNKCFKTWHGFSASEYRKQVLPNERIFNKPIDFENALLKLNPYLSSFNVQQDKAKLNNIEKHIIIPIKINFHSKAEYRDIFPLNIFMKTYEEIMFLFSRHNNINKFLPAKAILLRNMVDNLPDKLHTISSLNQMGLTVELCEKDLIYKEKYNSLSNTTLEEIVSVLQAPIHLVGNNNALFSINGLPTIYYSLYNMFVHTKGAITQLEKDYMIIRGMNSVFVLFYHNDSKTKRKFHIQLKDLKSGCMMIKRTVPGNYDVNKILNNIIPRLDFQAFHILDDIYDYIKGYVAFSYISEPNALDVEITVPIDTFILLELIPD